MDRKILATVRNAVLLLLVAGGCARVYAQVDQDVARIIEEKCYRCHSEKLVTLRVLAHENYLGGCGGCHVPFPEGHAESGCTACHTTPEETHFSLRDPDNQTRLAPDAGEACTGCHGAAPLSLGKGFPPLTDEDEMVMYARLGTLRSWIQPGGCMAKYLAPAEIEALTGWIDAVSADRHLAYNPYVYAVKLADDFEISGAGDDPAWFRARPHTVRLGLTPVTPLTDVQPTPQVRSITLKALYSDDYLYIRAEYRDPTLSMTGTESWLYDSAAGAWSNPPVTQVYAEVYPEAQVAVKQSEDRLGFIWNMSIPAYKTTYGCALKCHGNIPGSACFTDARGTGADVWIARAASGMAVSGGSQAGMLRIELEDGSYAVTAGRVSLQGFAEDGKLVGYMDVEGGYNARTAGMCPDGGSGIAGFNKNSTNTGPRYLEAAVESFMDAMVLTRDELDAGEALTADPDDPAYAGEALVAAAWSRYAAVSAVVPEKILAAPEGSRGDVQHAAAWCNGSWVHEFKRALTTGNADDIQFDPPAEYEFSVTVFDNCGWGEIPPMHNTYGNGQYQVLRFTR